MTTPQDHAGGDPLARHSLSPTELKVLVAAERENEAFLAFRAEHGNLRLYKVVSGDRSHSLGRRAEMDLSIPWDREISGLHAEVQCLGGEWTIVDDGLSSNGTFVNERRMSGRQRLRDGDRIRLGRTTLVYKAAQTPETEETVAGEDRPTLVLTDTQRRVLIALCRPFRDGDRYATPTTNQQIATEVFLSLDAVKMNLRTLFGKFELADLPQSQKRVRLVECALQFGVVSPRDLD
jgi:pSer/pThr/pTyr-binding forkhead associated (FHA) protein